MKLIVGLTGGALIVMAAVGVSQEGGLWLDGASVLLGLIGLALILRLVVR